PGGRRTTPSSAWGAWADVIARKRRQMAKRLYRSLSGIRVPYDLVVVTPADLEKHRDNPGLIYRSVLREGKVPAPSGPAPAG
ncbi:MAG: hypothetical protein AABZ85_05590, partial [Thermodesulfobacteriota bacterium]